MAGLISPWRMLYAGAAILALTWPCQAFAGWFVRNNQIAFHLTQQGHDRQALKYWDESAEGLYGRGTALMHLGRMQEAEQAFRESLEVAPHKTGFSDNMQMPVNIRPHFMASLWYNLGNCLYAQGELRQARQAWIKALGFEPGHAKAKHNLEIVDRLLGSREHHNQANLAGSNGTSKQKPSKHPHQQANTSQQQQRQHGLLPLHLPGMQHQESAAGSKSETKNGGKHSIASSGSSMQSNRISSHPSSSTSKHAQSPKNSSQQHDRQQHIQGMSRREAVLELRMVEEGVSVFLRHRLSEKGPPGTSTDGGKPW